MSELRENLKYWMKVKRLSANKVATLSDVPQPTIARFLKGEHEEPKGETVRKIAKGLGISESELRGINKAADIDDDIITAIKAATDAIKTFNVELTREEIFRIYRLTLDAATDEPLSKDDILRIIESFFAKKKKLTDVDAKLSQM